ncbi:hypothetical protein PM082_000392 [Marasmius tenuissimus]|nr:hypothetical protein PM082_000392 [Marasmius tenuissimus]
MIERIPSLLSSQITTPSNVTVDVTNWKPVKEDTEPDEIYRVYEWLHGMDYQSFDFQEIEVSSELKQLLQGPPIAFILSPTKDIVEKAVNLCNFNRFVKKPEERQGHEVFGAGPWEYILIPYEHMKKEKLPQLYQISHGTTTPLNFDINDFDTLPRLTSSLHPLVAIHYLTRRMPSSFGYSETVREGVINTFFEYRMSLPFYLDCPFAPRPPSPKRSHSEISGDDSEEDEQSCDCSHCSKPALDADCSSAEESEDEDEEQQEQPNVPRNVGEWALHVIPTPGDVLGTSERGEDDEEASSKVDEVLSRLEEENQRRLQLAKPILADRCTATRKRIRRS